MSSVPPDPNELLRLLLAQQQQQQQQQSVAPFAGPAPSYQQQPMGIYLPAPASQPWETTVPSLSQLIEYCQAARSTRATSTRAPAASRPQEIYEQLQRYLQASGVIKENNSSAAPATAQLSPNLPQDGGTMRASPQNVIASCPPQIKQKLQQPINVQAQQQQNLESQQQQESHLALLRLLAEINPGMAAAAVTQTLNIMSSPASQRQHQNQQGPHLHAETEEPLQPQQGVGQNEHQQTSTQSLFVLSPQQLTLPTHPGCVTFTGLGYPPRRRNDGNFIIPSAHKIIKPESNNGNRHSRIEQAMSLPLALHAQEGPSTGIIFNSTIPPAAWSKSLDHGLYRVKGKGQSNGSKGKAKSQTNESTSKACTQKSKRHPPPSHHLTEQSRGQQIALPLATASEAKQEPLVMAVVTSLPPPILTPDKVTLQNWSLELLETHVQHLKHARQPIPQHLAILLFNTRCKEERRKAKRLANRKSATLSRARRKAFIDDTTKDNARLRKKSAILKFLPDLVIAITMEGIITFCGSQVEKVLNYKTTHLMGANIGDIVVPDSRRTLQRMVQDRLCTTEHHASTSRKAVLGGRAHVNESGNSYAVENGKWSNPNSSSEAHIISDRSSDKSFPILDFNVYALQPFASAERRSKNSKNGSSKYKGMDNSTTAEMSSLTRKEICFGTKTYSQSYSETSNCDDSGEPTAKVEIFCRESSEPRFSCKANDRITNLVDDGMGARITANNAVDAKLSSVMDYPEMDSEDGPKTSEKAQEAGLLCHGKHFMKHPFASLETSAGGCSSSIAASFKNLTKKRGGTSASDYSGYGESKESPEESKGSPEGSSSLCESYIGLEKRRRLTTVYKVCFIRGDLSTVWCELTSSTLCVRAFVNDDSSFNPKAALAAITTPRGIKSAENYRSLNVLEEDEEDELLICIRPTVEGGKGGEEFRFTRGVNDGIDGEGTSISDDKSRAGQTNSVVNYSSVKVSSDLTRAQGGCPVDQQLFENYTGPKNIRQPSVSKKQEVASRLESTARQDVHSVAESLMLMSHHTSQL